MAIKTKPTPTFKPIKRWIFLLIVPFVLLATAAFVQYIGHALTDTPISIDRVAPESSEPGSIQSTLSGGTVDYFGNEPNEAPSDSRRSVDVVVSGMQILAVAMIIFGTPVWVVMLVLASKYNEALKKVQHKDPRSPVLKQ